MGHGGPRGLVVLFGTSINDANSLWPCWLALAILNPFSTVSRGRVSRRPARAIGPWPASRSTPGGSLRPDASGVQVRVDPRTTSEEVTAGIRLSSLGAAIGAIDPLDAHPAFEPSRFAMLALVDCRRDSAFCPRLRLQLSRRSISRRIIAALSESAPQRMTVAANDSRSSGSGVFERALRGIGPKFRRRSGDGLPTDGRPTVVGRCHGCFTGVKI